MMVQFVQIHVDSQYAQTTHDGFLVATSFRGLLPKVVIVEGVEIDLHASDSISLDLGIIWLVLPQLLLRDVLSFKELID